MDLVAFFDHTYRQRMRAKGARVETVAAAGRHNLDLLERQLVSVADHVPRPIERAG